MSSSATFRQGIYQSEFARKVARWLEAMPHPPLAIEISQDRVAAARWTRTGGLDSYAIEALPERRANAVGGGEQHRRCRRPYGVRLQG